MQRIVVFSVVGCLALVFASSSATAAGTDAGGYEVIANAFGFGVDIPADPCERNAVREIQIDDLLPDQALAPSEAADDAEAAHATDPKAPSARKGLDGDPSRPGAKPSPDAPSLADLQRIVCLLLKDAKHDACDSNIVGKPWKRLLTITELLTLEGDPCRSRVVVEGPASAECTLKDC